ncbi:hypothetical protein [Hyphomonas sp.]|uniref:hypothetical protein n=1 Tax=Hyphomonas sp. TaxID=87 RepID=UPI002607DBF2|nr:hypothetical protein [Hyphomonas sp.]
MPSAPFEAQLQGCDIARVEDVFQRFPEGLHIGDLRRGDEVKAGARARRGFVSHVCSLCGARRRKST